MNDSVCFEAQDEEGYSGPTMGDLLDDLAAVANATNPLVVAGVIDPIPARPTPSDASGDATVTLPSANQQTVQLAPPSSGGAFPPWAGSPLVFAARIANLNQVTGSSFDTSTFPTNPSLMAAVKQFQATHGLTADGEMGPATGAALQALAAGGVPASPTAPLAVTPVSPSAPSGNLTPAAATDKAKDNTKTMIAIGVGAVVLLGLAYYATK